MLVMVMPPYIVSQAMTMGYTLLPGSRVIVKVSTRSSAELYDTAFSYVRPSARAHSFVYTAWPVPSP